MGGALTRIKLLPVKEFDFDQNMGKETKLNLPVTHQFGFLAQDVLKIFPNLVAGITAPKIDVSANPGHPKITGATGFLAVNYTSFIPILTKAVQELSTQNDSLQTQIDTQQKINVDLQNQIAELKSIVQTLATKSGIVINQQSEKIRSASLQQNIPNPFSNTTTINYTLPQKYSSAKIIVVDKAGKVLKEVNVSEEVREV